MSEYKHLDSGQTQELPVYIGGIDGGTTVIQGGIYVKLESAE